MIRFGIMGAGRISHSFAGGARDAEGAELVAVAAKDLARAEAWAKSEDVPKFYGSYEELLADPDIDAVYIGTTTNYHYENIKACLNAGKHVICEKAMVETEERAKEVFDLAKEKGLFLMEAMWSRFMPKTEKVREWVAQGRIGEVKLIHATIGNLTDRDMTNRFYNPDLGGGAFYDLGVYLIDMIPYLVNQRIVDTQAWIDWAPTGVDESIQLCMKLETCMAATHATFTAKVPEDVYIYGEKGYIRVPKFHWGHEAILFNRDEEVVEHFKCPVDFAFMYEIEEVVRCIEAGRLTSEIASPEMTLESNRIFDKYLLKK